MAQESQGFIVDRTREHLTPTDIAVVRFRRLMLEGAKALQDGQGARGGSSVREPIACARAAPSRRRASPFEEVMRERFGSATGRVSS